MIFIVLIGLLAIPAVADEVLNRYDFNFPRDVISVSDFRATMRGLDQLDLGPLKPSAKRIVDQMEYSSDASVQAQYAGTGVTITKQSVSGTLVQEGSFSLKAVTDGTSNRSFERSLVLNLEPYQNLLIWERSSQTSDTFQFYVEDGSGNQSYWDITSNGSAGTWQQDTLDLSSPDGNSGTPADLSDIVAYGYRELTASTTYYFDTIKAVNGMTVSIRGTDLGDYYNHVYLGFQPLIIDAKSAPTITAPVSNPRIDILVIDSAGSLSWVTGTEAASPAVPWSSLSFDKLPICLVYNKTTETKILDYEDKDTDANQGYILADVRPFLRLAGGGLKKGADVASTASMTLGNDGNFFDITGTTNITSITAKPAGTVVWLQFDGILTVTDGSNLRLNGNFVTAAQSVLQLVSDGTNWYEVSRQPTASTFLGLTDTPSSYSGQGLKLVRVNSGATQLEFLSDPFNTTTGHHHNGTDSKKVLATNLDGTGITDGHFLYNNAGAIAGKAEHTMAVGDILLTSADTEEQGPNSQLKEIQLPVTGALRIKFDCRITAGSGRAWIKKNGTLVGTEQTCANTSYETKSQDISGWTLNDLLQLQVVFDGGGGGSNVLVRNLRIYGDKQFSFYITDP